MTNCVAETIGGKKKASLRYACVGKDMCTDRDHIVENNIHQSAKIHKGFDGMTQWPVTTSEWGKGWQNQEKTHTWLGWTYIRKPPKTQEDQFRYVLVSKNNCFDFMDRRI